MNSTLRLLLLTIPFVLVFSTGSAETFGVKKRRPKPHEYGNVVINNYSEQEKIAPVVFKHWVHRAKYTCRLCHVDIGFAMQAGETQVTEEDNRNGLYCGSCHDGKIAFGHEQKKLLGDDTTNCDRCHSYGKKVTFKNNFYTFRKGLPKERFGNGINWLVMEEKGMVTLVDYLEGVSMPRTKIKEPEEFSLKAKQPNMPSILFSHKKHAVWNGCELCHPEIFPVKRDSKPYTMQEIFDGKYCGGCHGIVAFASLDCQRCHTQPVQ